jgi:hypothetical protein
MLGSLLSRLVQQQPPGDAFDHLFTPYAPNGAPAQVLARIYQQYGGALADEMIPPQHKRFRALVQEIIADDPLAMTRLDGLALKRVTSAYVACFERFEPYQFQLGLWRNDPDFRAALAAARDAVIADLGAAAAAEQARRAHYSRWNECLAAPLDIRGDTVLDLVRKMAPDDWHEIALNWNWDHGVVELHWIASQRDCDRATAIYILCKGEPGEVATHASTYYAGFVRSVAARLENGFYPRAELGLHLRRRDRDAFQRQLDIARATGESPWQLPDGLIDHPGVRRHAPRYAISDGQLHFHYEHWLAHIADR